MRQVLRKAIADGHERIAVVCGAWHVPALGRTAAAGDGRRPHVARHAEGEGRVCAGCRGRIAGSPRPPGTAPACAARAGTRTCSSIPGEPGISRWFVGAARLLRDRGMSASPDDLIAATRAATTLAALRNRPRPGLAEVLDAADTVMAGASGMTLIDRELIVGDAIGEVPDDAPQVPLARDLAAQQRRVRLKPAATAQTVELDVRAAERPGAIGAAAPPARPRRAVGHRWRRAGAAAARSARRGGCCGSRS